MKAGFLEKLVERLGRIGPEEVQNYLIRLAEEKGFLETVFNTIQEGIIVTDSKGRITYLNHSSCEIFGLDAEKAIGKRLDERVRGLDWKSLTESGAAISRDMEIFYPTNRFINFYVVPLIIEPRETGGKSDIVSEQVGHAMILRDITESRRTAQQTIESERFNALTLLAAGVAHEIGNPLNSLHIHLQLMERQVQELKEANRDELAQSIKVAQSEVNRLDSIVSQFLRAIRPSRPQLHPENVNAIVDEAVRFFAPEIKDRDIVLEQELRSDLPPLQIDRDQMKQAFYNVIKNSLEAIKQRGMLRVPNRSGRYSRLNQLYRYRWRNVAGKFESRVRALFYNQSLGNGLGLIDRTPHCARARRRVVNRKQRRQRSRPYDSPAIR